tara:strand:- start:57 stop:305 length:249 start_codon:yes stop_codon:yes gene_type:complete
MITNNIAHRILGRLRKAARKVRAGYEIQPGLRFSAASIAIGYDMTIPNIVATKAIFKVSRTPIHAVEQVKSRYFGSSQTGYA